MFSTSHHDQMMLPCPPRAPPLPTMETRWKHNLELAPNCPRCASPNTKFCYYNNYSLSQPRYFCKGCRRYWTKGGSLRNVPVGGGCRKSRRSKSSRMAADQRAGMGNHGKNSTQFGAPVDDQSLSPSSAEFMAHGQTGSDIDLAMVFAKFLNQDGSSTAFEPEGSSGFVGHQELLISGANESLNVSNSLTPDSVQSEATTTGEISHQKHSSNLIQEYYHHDQLLQPQPDNQVPLGEQELVIESDHDQEMNAFGLQTLLGDEMVLDALWSDAAAATSFDPSNITCWHPMVQLQELDPFAMEDEDDDQLRINSPANFVSDNCWNTTSLDLPGFEFFSRA